MCTAKGGCIIKGGGKGVLPSWIQVHLGKGANESLCVWSQSTQHRIQVFGISFHRRQSTWNIHLKTFTPQKNVFSREGFSTGRDEITCLSQGSQSSNRTEVTEKPDRRPLSSRWHASIVLAREIHTTVCSAGTSRHKVLGNKSEEQGKEISLHLNARNLCLGKKNPKKLSWQCNNK